MKRFKILSFLGLLIALVVFLTLAQSPTLACGPGENCKPPKLFGWIDVDISADTTQANHVTIFITLSGLAPEGKKIGDSEVHSSAFLWSGSKMIAKGIILSTDVEEGKWFQYQFQRTFKLDPGKYGAGVFGELETWIKECQRKAWRLKFVDKDWEEIYFIVKAKVADFVPIGTDVKIGPLPCGVAYVDNWGLDLDSEMNPLVWQKYGDWTNVASCPNDFMIWSILPNGELPRSMIFRLMDKDAAQIVPAAGYLYLLDVPYMENKYESFHVDLNTTKIISFEEAGKIAPIPW